MTTPPAADIPQAAIKAAIKVLGYATADTTYINRWATAVLRAALPHLGFAAGVEASAQYVVQADVWTDSNLLQELAQGIRALSPPAASPWRPIAEAPKDGTYVLLSNKKIVSSGRFISRSIYSNAGYGVLEDGFYRDGATRPDRSVTHWMPLPPPPKESEQSMSDLAATLDAFPHGERHD